MIVQVLRFLILTLSLSVSTLAGPPAQTIDELLRGIREVLPKGWVAQYEMENQSLKVSRTEKVLSYHVVPSAPLEPDTPEMQEVSFCFRVSELLPVEVHRRRQAKNKRNNEELNAILERLPPAARRGKGGLSPRTDAERVLAAQYEAKKAERHNLPNFYFRDLSLSWIYRSVNFLSLVDKSVFEEYKQVHDKVLSVLSAHEEV